MEIKVNQDERGKYIEVFKMPGIGQVSYATSKPGTIRGNHYHKRKKEIIYVAEGEAKIRMRNRETNEVKEYLVSGEKPEAYEMPLTWTHNIENVGNGELKLILWASEVFNLQDPDTYAEEV